MPDEKPEKKKRAKRRNYQKELSDVTAFIEISIEVQGGYDLTDYSKGRISAFTQILTRLGGTSNGK